MQIVTEYQMPVLLPTNSISHSLGQRFQCFYFEKMKKSPTKKNSDILKQTRCRIHYNSFYLELMNGPDKPSQRSVM